MVKITRSSFIMRNLWLAIGLFSLLLAVCDASMEGIGVLQGIPAGPERYLGNEIANEVLGEALYLLSIGTNDFLENYNILPQRSLEFSIESTRTF